MAETTPLKTEELLRKGVRIPNIQSVDIGDDVKIDRISGSDVIIHSGVKIYGASTLILKGVEIGRQGPVTIENCHIGSDVKLDGGYFRDSVFLEKSRLQFGAHVREGTILEEGASAAHTVGLKQTILFPYVTLGSLINFCDCFMSGGTSPKDHSEVGSSYIHFNYTPNQDKATPSLLGDVPRGVMLDQRPIFLGGQGGLVGPCRLTFGTVTAAGTICRKDELRPDRLILGEPGQGGSIPYAPGRRHNIVRVVRNNLIYLGNLIALLQWYEQVRSAFISNNFPHSLLEGLKQTLCSGIEERIKQLKRYSRIADRSHVQLNGKTTNQEELNRRWSDLEAFIHEKCSQPGDLELRDEFLKVLQFKIDEHGREYIHVIKQLDGKEKRLGTRWLQGIVDETLKGAIDIIPSFDVKEV